MSAYHEHMEFVSALSFRPDTGEAVEEALSRVEDELSRAPELVLLFTTRHHAEGIEETVGRIREVLTVGGGLAGCVAQAVVGGAREVEEEPALVLWAGILPGVEWRISHLTATRMPEGVAVSGWQAPERPVGTILMADPYTFPTAAFVAGLEASHPGMPVVGGMALAGDGPGRARLVVHDEVHREGALAVAMAGDVDFCTVVSQGCRPVGQPGVVTASEGGQILEIGGRPALEFLQDVFDELPPDEQELVRSGLQLGVVVDEYLADFDRGDFLVRGVVGADPDRGSLTVGEHLAVGRTVQFQVRDPLSADEDLRELLSAQPPFEGVLLFTCNGRGRRFFGTPDHDASAVRDILGGPSTAGMFAAGEIGPVGGRNFLHGYTATLAGLRARGDQARP